MKSSKRAKKMRISDDDGYDGQRSSDDNDSDDSSDDVYAAVDYISDGDDEEDRDVEKLEELLIVESEDEHSLGGMLAASDVSSAHDWAGPNVFDDHMLLSAASFFDEEQLYTAMEVFGEADMASETAIETPVARRVHFEEDSDSSSDSDSHSDDEIPSDFLQQDALDPQLRRMIENDNENYATHRRQSNEMYAESDYGHSNIYHVESDAISDASESSGYESMHITYDDHLLPMLTPYKPMMARLQMKTFPLPQPSPTPGRSCAGTRLRRWPLPVMTRAILPAVDGVPSWALSLRIHISPSLSWTARGSIW
jgi:hypothetical protein